MTELLGVDELPDRPVVDLQAALGQLGDQPTQGEVLAPAALQQPLPMPTRDFLRSVTAHLAGRQATCLAELIDPPDHRTDGNTEAARRLSARQAVPFNRFDHPLTKIDRIGLRHSGWPPVQPEG
jgi:hypothetical protein